MGARFLFEAIGTHWKIDIHDDLSREREVVVRHTVDERIAVFDKDYSRFRSDSLVAMMAKEAGRYLLPEDAEPMMDVYQRLYRATSGRMTPLIGKTLSDAGYDAKYSFQGEATTAPTWEETMKWRPPRTLELRSPALLDFGAAGKGYLVDIVSEILLREGCRDFTVDAGGDIRTIGPTGARIGLEDPEDQEKAIGTVALRDMSICGSSGNRRAWGKYHHTIDPVTRESPTDHLAIWVIAESTLVADAIATAINFASPKDLLEEFSFEFLLLEPARTIRRSAGFEAELFTA